MYDVIGDIHGHADELVRLLELLGYDRRRGYYAHPARRVVFVGDFIDRGPQIREVLQLVRPMIDNEAALAVMGNHEFNSIAYHTRKAEAPGDFLRTHSPKNVKQHIHTLHQVPADELYDLIEWFRTLPLSLDLGGLRVVHACWDARQLNVIKEATERHGGVSDAFLAEAAQPENELFGAVDDVLKGKEIPLPDGRSFRDIDGHERRKIRIKWYESPNDRTLADYALPSVEQVPNVPVPRTTAEIVSPYSGDDPPVFFGHYWLQGQPPGRLEENVACLDYSVAKGGRLCAYRWSGERVLANENFVWVEAQGNCWNVTRTPAAGKHYYYVRVTQADGNLLWSAPVWVTVAGQ